MTFSHYNVCACVYQWLETEPETRAILLCSVLCKIASLTRTCMWWCVSGVTSKEGATGVFGGEGQCSAGQGATEQPSQAQGERAGQREVLTYRPQQGDTPSRGVCFV